MPSTTTKLEKGESAALNFAQDDKSQRVFVGLGWDPAVETSMKAKMIEMIGGAKTNHDLDLACYLLDERNQLLQTICAKAGQMVNQSGNVYHSGDDTDGLGLGDDEQISVELSKLSNQIYQIVFTAKISSGHVFDEIDTPEMRFVDGYTNREMQQVKLSGDSSSYRFVKLFRGNGGIWNIEFLDEYGEGYK